VGPSQTLRSERWRRENRGTERCGAGRPSAGKC